jgi:histidine triad (HIT) family protein
VPSPDPDCLFCKIVRGEIPASLVHQDEAVTVFRDINPQAPAHLLLVPNEHIPSTNELRPEHDALVGRLVRTVASVARQEGIAESGYRLLTNCGRDGGQLVMHLHFHLVGGRQLGWPPG